MARQRSESSAQGKRAAGKGKRMQRHKIDFSDIPELGEAQLKSMKRVGRPPMGSATKLLLAVRVDPEVLEALRILAHDAGKGYQTLIHEILEEYVEKKAA